ncbi:MAG: cation:proton antiporter, partial [Candidatus Marinimicrobia bacterium]|nr:cation:proton antiporter [Candidatus Neomarinimicrobiota bacterium]
MNNIFSISRYFKFILIALLISGSLFANSDGITSDSMTQRMMMLVIQLGIILFAARLGNILFEKLHVPGVLGELSAGIIIGPYLIGAIPLPGFPGGVFPISSATFPISPELYGISAVASIVLLFMIGLETNFRLFLRYSFVGSLVGIGGVLFSFLFGDVLAIIFSQVVFGKALGFLAPPCLFLGVISTATSVGITARILSEQRKLDSPEGVTILAGAVIDDVLGIILLAVGLGIVTASSRSGNMNWAHIGVIAAKAIGIWLTATVIGLLASSKISLLLKWFRDRTSIAMMAFGFALVLAGLFEEAGLAMIIGAYVMGLSLSKTD